MGPIIVACKAFQVFLIAVNVDRRNPWMQSMMIARDSAIGGKCRSIDIADYKLPKTL